MNLGTILRSLIYEDVNEKAFTPHEVFIFKFLHKKKDSLQTKDDYIRVLQPILRAAGLPMEDALYYYTMFLLNMRTDGKYEETTVDQVKDFSGEKAKKTPNYKMSDFAKMKMPFEGSNVRGFWEKDLNGERQYVITSYNWYPIYIYKNRKWYEVSKTYSRSTGKQMTQTRVGRVYPLTPMEMNQLRNGNSIEDILKNKVKKVTEFLNSEYLNKIKTRRTSASWIHRNPLKVTYQVTSVEPQESTVIANVEVSKVEEYRVTGEKPIEVTITPELSQTIGNIVRGELSWKTEQEGYDGYIIRPVISFPSTQTPPPADNTDEEPNNNP